MVKALFTDLGFEIANLARADLWRPRLHPRHGMEQYVRDARITMIYEGTNGIQALDLVGRKLPPDAGRLLRPFFHPVSEFIDANRGRRHGPFVAPLQAALRPSADRDRPYHGGGHGEPGRSRRRLGRLSAPVRPGGARLHVGADGQDRAPEGRGSPFYKAKIGTAKFFMQRMLPQTAALLAAIQSGSETMMEFDDAAFKKEKQASASFLKKRSKKLLLLKPVACVRHGLHSQQSFFASFCPQKEVLPSP